jgi:hypothetical protein
MAPITRMAVQGSLMRHFAAFFIRGLRISVELSTSLFLLFAFLGAQ